MDRYSLHPSDFILQQLSGRPQPAGQEDNHDQQGG
jgi:hypothetical protein